MKIKKFIFRLHTWLGLLSGLIVFIVCLTGAIWALRINGWVGGFPGDTPECKPEKPGQPLLLPSEIVFHAKVALGTDYPNYVSYTRGNAVRVAVYGENYQSILVNPYSGKVLPDPAFSGNSMGFDLWSFVGYGHRSLWLPWQIGRPIVNYATLLFVVILLSGLFLWYPNNLRSLPKRLRFHWTKRTGLRQKIFDWHSILGFYSCFILLAVCLTGMVWGLEWWSKGVYKVTTGGRELPAWGAVKSDTLTIDTLVTPQLAVDRIFIRLTEENPEAKGINLFYPNSADKSSSIGADVVWNKYVYYNSDRYTFDRYTLKELKSTGPYSGKYADAGFGDKLRRMNYDIHTGAIAGQPGRVLVFFAALFGASLPVTGVYLFIKKRRQKRKPVIPPK